MNKLITVMLLATVACGGKSSAPAQAPKAAAPASSENAGEDCYKQCLENGPDESPMTKADWPSKSQADKENECGMTCADANMPLTPDEMK